MKQMNSRAIPGSNYRSNGCKDLRRLRTPNRIQVEDTAL